MILSLDMIQTLGVSALVLYVGRFLKKRIRFLEQFCIPIPVIGGIIFSLIATIGYLSGLYQFSFEMDLKEVFMIAFFTTVGFNASVKPLKEGGRMLFILAVLSVILANLQNIVAVFVGPLVGVDRLTAMCTGSIPMIGGHGSAGAFGVILKEAGVEGATSIAMASATFGLVCGSLLGGPLGKYLIGKYHLTDGVKGRRVSAERSGMDSLKVIFPGKLSDGACQIVAAMGIGTLVTCLLTKAGLNFPSYFGAMLIAALIRNLSDFTHKFKIHMVEIEEIGEVSLSFFLAMALMELRPWDLAALAVPLLILLITQVILMAVYARFVAFPLLGKNYDSAVIVSGICGFGMGATPNAMANMKALTDKFVMSPVAFLIVPVLGSFFIDLVNGLDITAFINFLT